MIKGLLQHSPVLCLSVCVGLSVWRLGGPPVERCMSAMQAGTQMLKLRGSSKGLVRFYFLDEHRSCIRWRPSRKNEKAKSELAGPGGVTGDPPHARMRRPRMSGTVLGQETLPEQPPGRGRGSKTLNPESPQA